MKEWARFLYYLESKLGKPTVNRWLRPLHLTQFDARNLYLEAQDPFQIHWFQEHIKPLYLKELQTPSGHSFTLHFLLKGKPFKEDQKKGEKLQETPFSFLPDHLEPQATLSSFLTEGECHLPFQRVCEWLSSNPLPHLEGENPLYFYGPPGSGKSHLLMAITHELKQRGINAFYIRGENFAEHVIRAFRLSLLQEFRKTYRTIEALLIDDIEKLARKMSTQEEFFHTFNRLHSEGCPIIISAHHTPQRLDEIAERLVSRFEWGLTLPFPPPSKTLKIAIIHKKAKRLNVHLNDSLISFLFDNFHTLHSLIRALEALALRAPPDKPIDLEIAHSLLQDLIAEEAPKLLSTERIIACVAHHFGIKKEDILSRSQNKECVIPRQIAMYLCRKQLRLPYIKIGKLFARDHSTVMSSVKLISKAIEEKNKGIYFPLIAIKQTMCASLSL